MKEIAFSHISINRLLQQGPFSLRRLDIFKNNTKAPGPKNVQQRTKTALFLFSSRFRRVYIIGPYKDLQLASQ